MPFSFGRLRRVASNPALWCAIALALCVLVSRPRLEMGFDDDFSYVWTARVMADTGRLAYNGWATAMLGWQVYWGALFIKFFGFSFTAVRTSILIVGMATAALLQRLFVRMGLNDWNATLATLTITISPLFLPLAFSFMSDVPGFFALLICLYGCIRAVQAKSDRAAILWLVFAALTNAIGGTARQIIWLGVLVLVPSTAWVLRGRRGVLVAAATVWIVSAGFIAGCMHWFQQQPYSVHEDLFRGFHFRSHKYFALLLFSLPILVAFVVRYPIGERWARIQAGGAIMAILVVGILGTATWPRSIHSIGPFLLAPFAEEEVTAQGLTIAGLPGDRPDVLSMPVRITVTLLTFSAFLAFLITFFNASRLKQPPKTGNATTISDQALLTILGPFTAAYLLLLVTRITIFERYFFPLLFVFLLFLIRFYQIRISARLPVLTILFVTVFGAYGVAAMHDLFATDRAGLAVADQLRTAGVPRREIRAGVEYDAWTQIELAGYVNEPRLQLPKGAYHPTPRKSLPAECVFRFDSYTPAITGRYQLSHSSSPCFPESEFPPFQYTTWLPPRRHQIYILKLPN